VLVLAVAVEFCTIFWGTDLNISRGLTPTDAAIALSLFPLSMLLGRAAGSRLSQSMQPAHLLLAALVVASLGFPLYWLARTNLPAFVGLGVMGFGVANLYPLTLALAVGAVPHQSESASARASIASGVAIFAGPLLFGWIGDQAGIHSAQIVVAVLLGAMLIASQIARRLARQSAQAA
jgi:predicted MFS family arabinose efflux permease